MIIVKKLCLMGSIVLLLSLAFALVPAHVAHADSCRDQCGQDPVVANCTSSQYNMYATDFWVGHSEWEIRLKRSTVCSNEAWASLVLISGTNYLGNNQQDIQVFGPYGYQYDILYSHQFQSGAYTNMIQYSSYMTCARYEDFGSGLTVTAPSTCST